MLRHNITIRVFFNIFAAAQPRASLRNPVSGRCDAAVAAGATGSGWATISRNRAGHC